MALQVAKKRLAIGAGMGGIMLATAAVVSHWEGTTTYIYRDIVGVPTFCTGETDLSHYRPNMTIDECRTLLIKRLPYYVEPVRRCVGRDDLPPSMWVAFFSNAYNIGVTAFCRSSMARLARAGDFKGACAALSLYTIAGGKTVKGLINRRGDAVWGERTICEQDL